MLKGDVDLWEKGLVNIPIKRLMFCGYVLKVGKNNPLGDFEGGCHMHPCTINYLF
jgi:hypothetical protein